MIRVSLMRKRSTYRPNRLEVDVLTGKDAAHFCRVAAMPSKVAGAQSPQSPGLLVTPETKGEKKRLVLIRH